MKTEKMPESQNNRARNGREKDFATLIVKTDDGCRKGCHPCHIARWNKKGKWEEHRIFSIDEPGAWFDDAWNIHVDGCDNPQPTREHCIAFGLHYWGYRVDMVDYEGGFFNGLPNEYGHSLNTEE